MFYKLDKNSLQYKNATPRVFQIIGVAFFIIALLSVLYEYYNANNIEYITEETRAIIINDADKENQFTESRLKEYVLELNLKFPHIVIAQAHIETGHFKSKVFKENNNLFGMKEAKQRPTTNKGTENDHAFYNHWHESVVDYALYQAKYLSSIKTENEYLEYLRQNYAEDPNYISKLKEIIKENNDLVYISHQ